MNIYMRVDLEGASGVVSYEQCEPGKTEYEIGRRMLIGDVRAAAAGCFDGGASRVVVYDMHYYGRNIPLDAVDEGVDLICGKPRPQREFIRQCDALMLVGFHGKAGGGTLLEHSYDLETLDIRVNGASVGEIGIEAAIAGECGLPVILLTGDSAGCAEMKSLSPHTRTVEVKTSLSPRGGLCLPCATTWKRIRQAAADAVRHAKEVKPFSFALPTTVQVDLQPSVTIDLDRLGRVPDACFDGHTVTVKGDDLYQAWHRYRWLRGVGRRRYAGMTG